VRAAGITRTGGPVGPLGLPEPRSLAPDEVRISVVAAGVGNWDDLVRAGDWNVGVQPPMALGVEAAGIITELGEGLDDFAIGDKVLTHAVPLLGNGFWAEMAIVNVAHLAPKPGSVQKSRRSQ
jgi:NADPH:quinone reductase-like Zn-dependent oxidoreductase